MKVVLAVQEVDLKKKNDIADKILAEVTAENTKAEVEKAYGNYTKLLNAIRSRAVTRVSDF